MKPLKTDKNDGSLVVGEIIIMDTTWYSRTTKDLIVRGKIYECLFYRTKFETS